MSNPTLDSGIPILTEIITPPTKTDVIHPAATAPSTAHPHATPQAPAQTSAGDTTAQLAQFERDITARVLQQLLTRVDAMLEDRVRDSLADVLQIAVGSLSVEIRQGLEQTMKRVIAQTVSQEMQEIAKLPYFKK